MVDHSCDVSADSGSDSVVTRLFRILGPKMRFPFTSVPSSLSGVERPVPGLPARPGFWAWEVLLFMDFIANEGDAAASLLLLTYGAYWVTRCTPQRRTGYAREEG